ncbi:AraC family transcriptional regulator [Clostridium oryzae]|uniref:Transposon Tn10 TetD protein n=1 Tax=Clostridium oryzae TaxID=1450648 RepID=A0A1V4IYG1_9CLOT|nr:AraC family transcriptional regulator [Clostridium oryzae]OPJ64804.1 transposon Tn10 TetD protein [Clostridium oryzae]
MEWLDRMNDAVDYIELNLADKISYDKLAQIACCSTYHFQRMFSFITGVPLSEYIRRRRLTVAAFELQTSKIKVIDVAVKYGYESSEAFSRAFKNLHGIMPMSARDIGVSLKAFPKMTFSISIKGVSEMNYRIEVKEPFEVFGLELKTTVVNGKCYKDIPEFWSACGQDGRGEALLEAAGKKPGELLDAGVTYAHNSNGDMSYMLGCIKRNQVVSPEYTTLTIPKQTWAIFQTEWKSECDDEKLHEVWKRIYSEWFPVASYEHADCDFDMEMYFGNSQTGYSAEIWIPVAHK